MGNILDKSCGENKNTDFVFNNFFFKNCTVYEIIPKNMVKSEVPQMTSLHGAYWFRWISKATGTYAQAHNNAPGYPRTRTHTQTNK
jgi:hypothetical protein